MSIHLIADYGAGDLAFAEVIQPLVGLVPGATVLPTPVPAFDTVTAGFCAAQLALGDDPGERLIYTNVARGPITPIPDRATRASGSSPAPAPTESSSSGSTPNTASRSSGA